jgi:hypothetical protein
VTHICMIDANSICHFSFRMEMDDDGD